MKPGRPSGAELTTVPPADNVVAFERKQRPDPPAELTDYEAGVWARVVSAQPAGWFGPETQELLGSYCEHCGQAAVLKQKIADFDGAKQSIDEYEKLLNMREKQSRAMLAMARSLRITKQAGMRAPRGGGGSSGGPKPWDDV